MTSDELSNTCNFFKTHQNLVERQLSQRKRRIKKELFSFFFLITINWRRLFRALVLQYSYYCMFEIQYFRSKIIKQMWFDFLLFEIKITETCILLRWRIIWKISLNITICIQVTHLKINQCKFVFWKLMFRRTMAQMKQRSTCFRSMSPPSFWVIVWGSRFDDLLFTEVLKVTQKPLCSLRWAILGDNVYFTQHTKYVLHF